MFRPACALASLLLMGVFHGQPAPVFVVHSVDSAPVQAPLKQRDAQWAVVLGNAAGTRVAGADFLSLRRADAVLPAPPSGAQVIFANGDCLPGTAIRLADERLVFEPPLAQPSEVNLPLSALSVLWCADPAFLDQPDRARRRLSFERRTQDVVWLRNGDQLQGNLTGLDQDSVRLEVNRKVVKVERDTVAVVAFNNELARRLRPADRYGHLLLADGTRLGVTSVQADGKTLTAKTLFGATLRVPLAQLRALDVRQGKAVYLSDLKPTAYQYTPFLPGLEFPYVADGSVVGDDLRLGGSTFVKGLGLHSGSRLVFDLQGDYRRFEALVGLDDRTGSKGSARIAVLADGKPLTLDGDPELTWRAGPRSLRLDVRGVRELTLVVTDGKLPFVQGHVNWADARLVK